MHRESRSASAASLCAILSSTDLIDLVMLCRARSDADAARRSRPPSPTAREISLVSAAISSSACSARSTFPKVLGFLQFFSQLGEPAFVSDLGLLVEHLTRVAQVRDMNPCPFEILIPPVANRELTDWFRPPRAGSQFHPPDPARGILPPDDAADERCIRVPSCPLDERLSRRTLPSSTRPLCGTRPLGGTDARPRVAGTSRTRSSATRLKCHLYF